MNEHRIRIARSARYFTCGDSASRNVWLVLHGYGELAEEFIDHFEVFGRSLFVAPEGLSRFYQAHHSKVGASWMTRVDREAEISDYCRLLDSVCRETVPAGAHLAVLGFSQGVHTACRWVARGLPAPLKKLVLWGSGLPIDLDEAGFAVAASSGATFVVGSRDEYHTDEAIAVNMRRMKAMGVPATVMRYEGGHAIDVDVLRTIVDGRETG